MKSAKFTDIHWGAKNNSTMHNQDNLDFIDWFIENTIKEKCDTIEFLGDWFENRNAINIETLDFSRLALEKLNALGLPIYFIVGNHDLYRRHTRDIHSVKMFQQFENIIVVEDITIVNDEVLYCPYLFKEEYARLAQYDHIPVWNGHFDFKGFVLTGAAMKSEHGLNHKLFKKQKRIFSGHYHKRQTTDNVTYIGNTFPTNFGDAGDKERGMAIYDSKKDDLKFINWDICPTYIRTSLSIVLADEWQLPPNERMRVVCTNDIDISYSEAQIIKETLNEKYKFREFRLEENFLERKEALEESLAEDQDDSSSVHEFIVNALNGVGDIKNIDKKKLIEIYKKL